MNPLPAEAHSRGGRWQRLVHIPWSIALLLALPVQIAVVWLARTASDDFDRYAAYAQRSGSPMPPFDLEQWRYFARDRLRRMVSNAFASSLPRGGTLPEYELAIDPDKLTALDRGLPESGRLDGKRALLTTPDGAEHAVKARYMGDNYWHWLYEQKSWHLKLGDDDSWRGSSVFGLKNAPSLYAIDEPTVTRLAREIGVLAPEVEPASLRMNGAFAGLYQYWGVADESLLRRYRRAPGRIFSGDGAPADERDGVSRLWRDPQYWHEEGSRDTAPADDRRQIEAVLAAVGAGDPIAFHAFAASHFDMNRFAQWIAIDRAFGSSHHDYHHNHKLYFDPGRGRCEPILWDLNDWSIDAETFRLDQALNPLLIALRRDPAFDLQLFRTLHDLLQTTLSPDRVDALLTELDAASHAARAAAKDRDGRTVDATLLRLPLRHCAFYSMAEYDAALQRLRRGYRDRHARLLAMLDRCAVSVQSEAMAGGAVVTFVAGGAVAAEWHALAADSDAGGEVVLLRDRNRNGRLDDADDVVARARGARVRLEVGEILAPAVVEVPVQVDLPILWGRVDLADAPQRYRYFVRGARADGLAFELRNAVTGRTVAPAPPAADGVEPAGAVHAFDLPRAPAPTTVVLGPGEVRIDATRRYGASTTLRLEPGTTVLLGAGASLFCSGAVVGAGTPTAPIRFRPQREGEPFGSIVLVGPGTAGSRLLHCDFAGGAATDLDWLHCAGMVTVADTHGVELRGCRFGAATAAAAALQWASVGGGEVSDCTFAGARTDAFALDCCTDVTVRGCAVADCVGNGLRCATGSAHVVDCSFSGCGAAGLAVGGDAVIELHGCAFEDCAVGVAVAAGGRAAADVLTMRACALGVDLAAANQRQGRGGVLIADRLDFRGHGRAIATAAGATLELRARVENGAAVTR